MMRAGGVNSSAPTMQCLSGVPDLEKTLHLT